MKNINLKIDKEEFKYFLSIIVELNKVSDSIKIKWENENIFIYSIVGDNKKIDVLKIFILKRDKLFNDLPDLNFTWIIIQAKQWLKQSSFLMEDDDDIELSMYYQEENNVIYSTQLKNSTLQLSSIGGDDTIKNIPSNFIKNNMNPKNAEWSVELSEDFIKRVKKLSKLTGNETICFNKSTESNVVLREEGIWDLKLTTNTEVENGIWNFRKEYLDKITLTEKLIFGIFPSYIVVKELNSMLLFNLDLIS